MQKNTDVRDSYGTPVRVGTVTTDGWIVTEVSDEDINSTGTATEVWITVTHEGGGVNRCRTVYSYHDDAYITDEITST